MNDTAPPTLMALTADDFELDVLADGSIVPLMGDEDGSWTAFGHVDAGRFREAVSLYVGDYYDSMTADEFGEMLHRHWVVTASSEADGWTTRKVAGPEVEESWPLTHLPA